jgi:putative peptidoglycan lipid II flippase
MDSTKSIIKSASHFFSGTMLSRISGACRDIAMAFAFGTKETVAAFFVAFRLAHLLRRLFGEGALQTAFVPKFENLRKHSPERAASFFTSLYAVLFVFLIGIALCGSSILAAILPSLNDGGKEIALLTAIMMPSLIFICLWGLNCSLMQCERCYFLPSAAPIIFNVVWITGALLIWLTSPAYPMGWLSVAIVAASIAQWIITVPKTLNILRNWGFPKPSFKNPDIRTLAKPLLLGILGVAAVQINSALDPLFARIADPEGPAFLWYAIRIQQVPLALFGIALSSALLPPLARALENNNLNQFHRFLNYCLKRTLLLMVPATAGLILLGNWGIKLVYGHGRFTEASIVGTNLCLTGYAIGLIPMAMILIYAPAYYARGNYFIPSFASTLSVALNTSLNALFILKMGYGPESVAFATSLSAWANYALLVFTSRKILMNPTLDPAID